jgi:hypothetical protein
LALAVPLMSDPGQKSEYRISIAWPTPGSLSATRSGSAWAGLANSCYWIDPVRQVAAVYATL